LNKIVRHETKYRLGRRYRLAVL